MALNHLTVSEMVSLTEDWVIPTGPLYLALIAIPGMDALLPHVISAHQGLLGNQSVAQEQELDDLTTETGIKDGSFDCFARAGYYTLMAHANLARALGDEAGARVFESMRTTLYPTELKVTKLSYREESGHATLLQSRMDAKLEQGLAGVPMQGRTLLDVVRAWITAGQELGALENRRAEAKFSDQRVNASPMRQQWMRAIMAVRTVLDLVAGTLPPVVADALARIRAAEAAAERRSRTGTPTDGELPAETPAEAPAEAPLEPTPSV